MSFAKYIQQAVDARTGHRVKLVDESLYITCNGTGVKEINTRITAS